MEDKTNPSPSQLNNSPPKYGGEKTIQPSKSLIDELNKQKQASPQQPPGNPQASPAASPAPAANQPQYVNSSETLVGSQIQPDKQPFFRGMPIGIYFIIGLLAVGFVLGFFNSNTSVLETLGLLVNLVLAIGLLFRKEAARKTIVIFSGILIALYVLVLVGLIAVKSEANTKYRQAQSDLSKLSSNSQLTMQQQQQISSYKTTMTAQMKLINTKYRL